MKGKTEEEWLWLVFEFFIIDTGEQPLDNVRSPPILQKIMSEDGARIL